MIITLLIIAWSVAGIVVLVLLYDDGAYPSNSLQKNAITVAACGPIAWVGGAIIAGYSALKEWLERTS